MNGNSLVFPVKIFYWHFTIKAKMECNITDFCYFFSRYTTFEMGWGETIDFWKSQEAWKKKITFVHLELDGRIRWYFLVSSRTESTSDGEGQQLASIRDVTTTPCP